MSGFLTRHCVFSAVCGHSFTISVFVMKVEEAFLMEDKKCSITSFFSVFKQTPQRKMGKAKAHQTLSKWEM